MDKTSVNHKCQCGLKETNNIWILCSRTKMLDFNYRN